MEHSHIRVIERSTGTIWASYPKHQLPRQDLPAKIILLPEKCLQLPRGVKWTSSWQLMAGQGPVKIFSAHLPNGVKIQNLAWKTLIPSVKNWERRGHLYWQKQSRLFIFEEFTPDEKISPIDLQETSINNPERITGLIDRYLSFIEKREDASSTLYQDPKDGRYFQHLSQKNYPSLSPSEILVEVNNSQWMYFYLEKKLGLISNKLEQEEFIASLKDDVGEYPCEEKDCTQKAIRMGSLCPTHHYKALFGKKN